MFLLETPLWTPGRTRSFAAQVMSTGSSLRPGTSSFTSALVQVRTRRVNILHAVGNVALDARARRGAWAHGRLSMGDAQLAVAQEHWRERVADRPLEGVGDVDARDDPLHDLYGFKRNTRHVISNVNGFSFEIARGHGTHQCSRVRQRKYSCMEPRRC